VLQDLPVLRGHLVLRVRQVPLDPQVLPDRKVLQVIKGRRDLLVSLVSLVLLGHKGLLAQLGPQARKVQLGPQASRVQLGPQASRVRQEQQVPDRKDHRV